MEINVRIAGAAGQGMQTTAEMLAKAITRSGLFAFSHTDAESRIRGGLNFSHLRLAEKPLRGVTRRVDILVAQSPEALSRLEPALRADSLVLAQEKTDHPLAAPLNLAALAQEAGSAKASGVVALGVITALLGLDSGVVKKIVREGFTAKPKLVDLNLAALAKGLAAGAGLAQGDRFRLPAGPGGAGRLLLTGGQAISLGAVAGGCTFVAGYPMSPATSILAALAQWSSEAGVVVEQAEDEIAAINMVAGASFAGARAMTATSGGGFCLMTEGVSLLGMIEAPAVIVVAQRPGPATGLPTRLAQGDLNLVRHAGHGTFPRIILAPRDIPECFDLSARAFDLAERFQVPVFILTDQHLQDGLATVEPFPLAGRPIRRHLLTAEELDQRGVYRRFQITDSGISPLAAPGVSEQVVVVDSDEHDEDGHLTEEADLAAAMAAKRLRKAEAVARQTWEPRPEGQIRGRPLVISWGSSYETVAEAVARIRTGGEALAHLNLEWLWPRPGTRLAGLMDQASRVIVVENSVGAELVSILREVTLRPVDGVINRLDGRPFSVEEMEDRLGQEVRA